MVSAEGTRRLTVSLYPGLHYQPTGSPPGASLRLEWRVQDPAVSVLDADHLGLADQPPVLVVEDTAE